MSDLILLDSSAWLIHLFQEDGSEHITSYLEGNATKISIASPSLVEVSSRLFSIGHGEKWSLFWETYIQIFDEIFPISTAVAQRAITIRQGTPTRLPTVDALIAACASVCGATLVHRDKHFLDIPTQLLSQHYLT